MIEIARRNAMLETLDYIVEHELGSHWTLEGHMARKAALLDIINNSEHFDLRNKVAKTDAKKAYDEARAKLASL